MMTLLRMRDGNHLTNAAHTTVLNHFFDSSLIFSIDKLIKIEKIDAFFLLFHFSGKSLTLYLLFSDDSCLGTVLRVF
jgi:hypothetical protein